MKPRKLLAMLLSLAMAFSLMVPAATATEEDSECTDCMHEAAINSVHYDTLINAISAAQEDEIIVLLKSVSGAGAVIDKNITIDFKGHTYTFNSGVGSTGTESNGFQILQDNTVTLKNGTLNIAETSANTFYTVIQNYADLTLTDMTLDATYADKWSNVPTDQDSYALSINCGNVVINGKTNIIANDEGALAYAFDSCKYSTYEAPTVTVSTSGVIDGNMNVAGGSLRIISGSFTDLATALKYADSDAVVSLAGDVALTNPNKSFSISDKTVTVDLNGHTVEAQGDAFVVTDAGHLILKDTVGTSEVKGGQSGAGSWTAVWAYKDGKATIQGGSFSVGGDSGASDATHQNDCIYAGSTSGLTAGTIVIEGGTFTNSDTTVWPLNMKDGSASSITVTGGTFIGWNPAEAYTEPAPARPISFVPSGYYAKELGDTYTVHNSNTIVGKSVTLDGNIFVPAGGIVVNTATTLNLNGKTVSAPADTAGDGVFHVVSGGTLTINGEGTVNGVGNNNYSMAIWADGGQVVINGGTYVNEGAGADNHYDLIYAKNGGSVEISGGIFACQTPNWTLNKHDSTNGTISVKGGTFYQYNPAVSNTENPTANFVADGYMAFKNDNNYVIKCKNATVVYDSNGGSAVASETVDATTENCHFTRPVDPTRFGYTFAGWYCEADLTTPYDFTSVPAPGDEMILYAKWTAMSSSGSSTSSKPSNTTSSTEKNPDGSTTTTVTNRATGVVTETTKTSDGVIGTTKTDADGNIIEMEATVPAAAAKNGEPVTLPVEVKAAGNTDQAIAISVNVPKNGATVKIPVEDVTPGTVVIVVDEDGNETILPLTLLTKEGVVVTLAEDSAIKIVDNNKDFLDVPQDYALADSIDFVSARGLFEGNTETTFNPHASTTIAQTMTVLARLSGEDFYGADATQKGAAWAAEKGLDDGTDIRKAITREQMVVMMWKLAGQPASEQVLTASDMNQISADAITAMQWAVEMGILKGNSDGTLNPSGNASRAHVAAFVERYVNALAK